jgi:hypothetical protein
MVWEAPMRTTVSRLADTVSADGKGAAPFNPVSKCHFPIGDIDPSSELESDFLKMRDLRKSHAFM